jgi:hypothetical protein
MIMSSTVELPTEEERAAAAAVLRMIWGLHVSRAVYAVAELGVADLLADGPVSGLRPGVIRPVTFPYGIIEGLVA